jgi:hypothetical protein
MTKLEKKQYELIKILYGQVIDLSMMSKIELGDDVTSKVNKLTKEISQLKDTYVPFVSEVEEFNALMGKPNNYTPNIPEEKEWMFVYNFILGKISLDL